MTGSQTKVSSKNFLL